MSNEVFPTIIGQRWDQTRTPLFATQLQRSVSGKEAALQQRIYPLWQWGLSFERLKDNAVANELKSLVGFYLRHYGAFDSWLYNDLSDHNVANESIGTGNGVGRNFQLVRTYGGFVEPILNPMANANNNPIVIRVANNAWNAANYTVSLSTGIVTFAANNAPANGAAITASFYYYWRCRFVEYEEGDDAFSQFMRNLWESKRVEFLTRR